MKLGKLTISGSRWPWSAYLKRPDGSVIKYGWRPHKAKLPGTAMLNPTGARFGGGWNYNLGVQVSDSTVLVHLLFGTVRFTWDSKAGQRWSQAAGKRFGEWLLDIVKKTREAGLPPVTAEDVTPIVDKVWAEAEAEIPTPADVLSKIDKALEGSKDRSFRPLNDPGVTSGQPIQATPIRLFEQGRELYRNGITYDQAALMAPRVDLAYKIQEGWLAEARLADAVKFSQDLGELTGTSAAVRDVFPRDGR